MENACDFARFGCRTRISSEDHLNAHTRDNVSVHLKLLCGAFDKEVEKNKALTEKLDAVNKVLKEHEKKIQELSTQPAGDRAKLVPSSPQFGKAEITRDSEVSSSEPVFRRTPSSTFSIGSRSANNVSSVTPPGSLTRDNDIPPAKETPTPPSSGTKERENKEVPSPANSAREILAPKDVNRDSAENARNGNNRDSIELTGKRLSDNSATSLTSNVQKRNSSRRGRANTGINDDGLPEGFERGVLWEYDPSADEWARGQLVFKMEQRSFADGALRTAHMVEVISSVTPVEGAPISSVVGDKTLKSTVPLEIGKSGDQFVAKISKTTVPNERYFEDVKMQCICRELGIKFNNQGVPKKVEFLMAWVLEIQRGTDIIIVGLEPFMAGDFKKHTTNDGINLNERNTPQAFSHFTWEHSNHTLLVVDLQGVNDFYTDPQVHTKGGKDFGLGNLGMRGIDKFLKSHKCNPVCAHLTLPGIGVDSSLSSRRRLIRGTMKAPSIEKDIELAPSTPDIEAPANLENGEFQCVQTISGLDDRVICVSVHKQQLFSATADGTVKVWALPECVVVSTIRAHRKSVESMCFSAKYLFTASADQSIKAWDLADFQLVDRLKDHTGEVNAVTVAGDRLISASFDKSIRVWNIQNFKCTNTLEGHSKSVKCLVAAGNIVFSGSNDGTIKVWSLVKMSCIFSVDGHDQWVKALALKDYTLFSGAHDYLIKEWDLKNFAATDTFSEHSDNITALLTTQKFLFSASEDKTIRVWKYNSKSSSAILKGHRSGVQSLCTDGKCLYSASDDYTIKVWKWAWK